jgi:hypothetical protein
MCRAAAPKMATVTTRSRHRAKCEMQNIERSEKINYCHADIIQFRQFNVFKGTFLRFLIIRKFISFLPQKFTQQRTLFVTKQINTFKGFS